MSRHNKKPKYKLDPKKFDPAPEKERKEKDWNESDLYWEMLREKNRRAH